MNSKIKSKRAIHFGKVLRVRNLYMNEESLKGYEETVRKQNPNISDEDLLRNIEALMRRDSFYNAVMDEVASAYEFELDISEINEGINTLSRNYGEIPRESLETKVKMSIYRQLIYEDLARSWNILVPDEDVKRVLEDYYRNTGHPIREYLMNKEKFEEIRKMMEEGLITERLLNAFQPHYDVK